MIKYISIAILCLVHYNVNGQQHSANKLDSLMIQHLLAHDEFHSIDTSNYDNILGYMFSRNVFSCSAKNGFSVIKFGANASHSNVYLAVFQNDSLIIFSRREHCKKLGDSQAKNIRCKM